MAGRTRRALSVGVWGTLLVGVAAVGVGLWGMKTSAAVGEEAATTQPAAGGETDAGTYARLSELRRRLGVTDMALAAMAPSTSSGQARAGEWAEGVLSRLVGWDEANAAAWEARRRATRAAERELRGALRRLSVGGAGGAARAAVPGLKGAVAAAKAAEGQLLAAAREHLSAAMTDAQRAAWAAIRANPASAGRYAGAPNVTTAQLTASGLAKTNLARRCAVAATSAERQAAAAECERSLANILTPAQRTALATASANIRRHMPAVLAASAKVLPPPRDPPQPPPPAE